MNKIKIVLCFSMIWLLLAIAYNAFSQDSLNVKRAFSVDIQKELLDNEDFNYIERGEYKVNRTEGFWYWFREFMNEYFYTAIGNPVTEWIIYILVFVILTWVVVKLAMGGNKSAVELGNGNKNRLFEDLKDIDENFNFDLAIADALKIRNFNLALRYQFIKILYHLDKLEYLRMKPDKTNSDYVRELSKSPVFQEFKPVSSMVERVLYGGYSLDEDDFQTANNYCKIILKNNHK